MKQILLFCILLFAASQTMAQQFGSCTANLSFADSMAGVYPLPYDLATNPEGGIPDSACLNKQFQFVFNAVVSEQLVLGGSEVPLDSLVLATTGAVSGLPAGITYACDPPSCSFPKNSVGCVVIYGTATNMANLGENLMVIQATAFSPFFPSGVPLTFPNPLFFPGSYSLYVHPEDYANCSVFVNAGEVFTALEEIRMFPNPVQDMANFLLSSTKAVNYEFSVANMMGQTIHRQVIPAVQGETAFYYSTSELPNGVYLYTFREGQSAKTGKMVVQR